MSAVAMETPETRHTATLS